MIPKPRLRHYIYLVGGVAYLLSVKNPICSLRPADWYVPALVLFVTLLGTELYFMISRSYRIKRYLDQGDPEAFLAETRKELAAVPGRHWQDFYRINSTAGLYYLGRFEEALAILAEVRPQKLHKVYRSLYVNNRLANLLGAERIDEAAQFVREHEAMFQPGTHNQKFYYALQANLGTLKFYQGELAVARHLLEESMKSHQQPLALGIGHYYLGCIAKAEGRQEEAHAHYDKARELGQKTFVVDRLE